MERLPYEILQLVAGWLLPRYQCRLAMTSKHHYTYLYSYLLRWHAKKHPIPHIYYKLYHKKGKFMTIIITPEKPCIRLLNVIVDDLNIKNLTTMRYNEIGPNVAGSDNDINNPHYCYRDELYHWEVNREFILFRKYKILNGYYNYVHGDVLLPYINIQQPIYSLKPKLLNCIYDKLNMDDRRNLFSAITMSY